jgi:hypothetical protein
MIGQLFQLLVVLQPTAPFLWHGHIYLLDSSGFFIKVIAKQQIAGLVQAALSGAQTPYAEAPEPAVNALVFTNLLSNLLL